jgi:hypothetical protein
VTELMGGPARKFCGQWIGRISMKEKSRVHRKETRFWSRGGSPKGD